ncbi:DUF934 domain-containing protein [Alteriqipengyuania sp.]|uniref:DUF934 domain-containing protein n=1 Tax=Alteriqipengyuania sp. TaxID=2800692 RepID=UPI0035121B30
MPLLDAKGLTQDEATFVELDALDSVLCDRGPGDRIGVQVPAEADGESLARGASRADLIAITFEKTGNGRIFSLAETLRQRGYRGTIRVVGPLIPDQFAFALACGIDQVEITEEHLARQPLEQWRAAAATITRTYVGPDGIFARRAQARKAERGAA